VSVRLWPLLLLCCVLAAACDRQDEQPESHLSKGYELLKTDPEQALGQFRQVEPKNHPSALYGIGLAHEGLRQFDQAAAALQQAKAAAPEQTGPRIAWARVQLLRGRIAEAHRELGAVLDQTPGDLQAVLLFCVSAMTKPQRVQALAKLRDWPGRRPAETKAAALPAEYLLALAAFESYAGNAAQAKARHQQGKAAQLSAPSGALALAKLSRGLHKPQLAIALVRKLASAKRGPAMLHEIAELAFALNHLPAVKMAIDQFPIYPEQPLTLLLTGRYQLAIRDASGAVESLSRGLKRLPKNDTANRDRGEYLLGKALLSVGRPQEAKQVLKKLLERNPKQLATALALSATELRLGETGAAVERLKRLQRQHPKSVKVLERLGLTQLKARDYAAAEQSFRKLARLAPKDNRPPRLVARALAAQGKSAEVTRELEQAADRKPLEISSVRVLVGHYLKRQQPQEALAAIQRRIKSAPDPAAMQLLLAATYEKLGRKRQLRKTLVELTRSAPENATAWTALARLEQLEGKPAAALAALERLVKLTPDSPGAHARLAAHHARNGKPTEAARHYEELLGLAGDDFIALNNAAMLYADELEQPERAIELAERARKLAPRHPAVADTLGWALLRPRCWSARAATLARPKRASTTPPRCSERGSGSRPGVSCRS
jgi:tetratricopeptide (TPR) repeat protein